jgi:hypothetical protein
MTTSLDAPGRRLRLFLLWSARLVLLAYVFQIGAFDHWSPSPSDVVGVMDSSAHVAHCHGGPGSCAGDASVVASIGEVALLPLPPSLVLAESLPASSAHTSAFLSPPSQPPRV